jgi:hypothetical protein
MGYPPRLGRKEPVCPGRRRTGRLNEGRRGSEVTVGMPGPT